MEENLRKELRDYAWKYFDRHAEQRLKAFNFYILLCGAIVAGVAASLRDDGPQWLAILLALILSVVSFVFAKLDRRTRFLTKHSEEALKVIEGAMKELPDESSGAPHRCKLFLREKYEQGKCGPEEYSYTTCFRWLFLLFGFGGLALAAHLGRKMHSEPKVAPPPIVTSINR